jgi:predicted ester cyclase
LPELAARQRGKHSIQQINAGSHCAAQSRIWFVREENWKMAHPGDPKELVLACVDAINKEDFKTARQFVSNDLSFAGVMGSRQGADAYFADMEHMRLKYEVKKIFADGNDVCLFYDLKMSGTNIFVCAWYQVSGGKIQSLRVVFDPRPVLEAQSKLKKSA